MADKSADSSMFYNLADPDNRFPNYETGAEEYGPAPPFGYNKHDPFNMKPFNPNLISALTGGPMHYPPTFTTGLHIPPPYNMLGLPSYPVAQPLAPTLPTVQAPHVPPLLPMLPAPGSVHTLPELHVPGTFSAFPDLPYYGSVTPQVHNSMDPSNQFPNPLNGDMNNPGPALAGGRNPYDPHNVIGAPYMNDEMHNRMAAQYQSPQAPYILKPKPTKKKAKGKKSRR